ncbi:hypothetical protein [Streptomyces sp. NPDC050504]|uniref:hypothetical protein n=1 Tax=Streptomyces sp. NPDC050504 TaxID=3365618 RepID=UPI003799D1BA
MCISVAPAAFSGTTLYVGRQTHPEHGLIHVLGYQNTAVNLSRGPNAMLLHLPGVGMTPRNFVPVGHDADVLVRMVEAVRPAPEDGPVPMDWMECAEPEAHVVHVFEHDVYTVLLAADPTCVPDALAQVPAHKRPVLEPELFEFYAERYSQHTIAVCCFDNAQAQEAKPLLMWFEPLDDGELVAPALDCHSGAAPDLGARVDVDHWVVFGTDECGEEWGEPVTYRSGMRRRLRRLLPDRVMGARFDGALPNGDFALSHEALLAGDLGRVRRVGPA